ncbi:MAG: aminotransferase, partial [Zetaproteobacteria bacterium CG23_combo_of_CG06-09_8_20_14_all_54_7]
GGASFCNFVLLRHEQSGEILRRLEDRGIIPRPLAPYGMVDYLRISVGTAAENSECLQALEAILADLGA